MNNVQFDEQSPSYVPQKKSGLGGLIIKWGLAKTEKGAQQVLLGIAVVAVILATWLLIGSGGGGAPADTFVDDFNDGF